MSNYIRNWTRSTCSIKQLKKRVPVISWLPIYSASFALSDLIAGVTVGLTVIPQGIAYALVAGLPPQYGLYSAFMGCFVYIFFGTSKDITIGPTAIMALMTHEHADKGVDYAILLAFLSGIIIVIMGVLKLGVVIDFISVPVIAGFTSAAAITIASSQVKSIFGLEIRHHVHIEGITGTWVDIVENFDTARVADSILGITCVVLLLLMRALKNVTWFKIPENAEDATMMQKCFGKLSPEIRKGVERTVWIISTGRNAIVVIVCALMAYGFDPVIDDDDPRNSTFILTGNIKAGLPPFEPPPFSIPGTNSTDHGTTFPEMISELGSALAIIPLIAILEHIAIAKAFAGGKQLDANQEMMALGVCNILGSFVQAMPTTGSFSRTAVNSASGVKTPFGGAYTGILVLMALGLLMPYCAYIPKASLAAVIITAVIFSVEYEVVRPMWRSKRLDLIPAFTTFMCCLFWALEFGILIGVGVQIFFILYNAARPDIDVNVRDLHDDVRTKFLWVSPDRALTFPAINYVRSVIGKAATTHAESTMPVVVDCSHISSADFTAAKGFKSMINDFRNRNQPLIFYNPLASVLDTFVGANIEEFVVVHSLDDLNNHLHSLLCVDAETGQRICISAHTHHRSRTTSQSSENSLPDPQVTSDLSESLVRNESNQEEQT